MFFVEMHIELYLSIAGFYWEKLLNYLLCLPEWLAEISEWYLSC